MVLPSLVSLLMGAPPVSASAAAPQRGFELVSPAKKDGQTAGSFGDGPGYAVSSDDSGRVLYEVSGPVGANPARGVQQYALGVRTSSGWDSRAPLPMKSSGPVTLNDLGYGPLASSDLTQVAFSTNEPLDSSIPPSPPGMAGSGGLYLTNTDAPGSVTWLSRPTASNPFPLPGQLDPATDAATPAGSSPDLGVLYFSTNGTLVPEDAPRRPNVVSPASSGTSNRGVYRYANGKLEAAGILPGPDGTVDPFGAIPAGGMLNANQVTTNDADSFLNQVSQDGRKLFFVSPDPDGPSPDKPQLYVRTDNQTTVRVSDSAITGNPAPSGVRGFTLPLTRRSSPPAGGAYAYAPPDGSRVVFGSVDQLTTTAPVDSNVKFYEFDTGSSALSYLPGVNGLPMGGTADGSQMLFLTSAGDPVAGAAQLGVISDGVVTKVGDVPSLTGVTLHAVHASADGSAIAFSTTATLSGFNTGGFDQTYRYTPADGKLDCVSCPPPGQTPSGNAHLSVFDNEAGRTAHGELVNNRAISDDGSKVFFDTPDPLVAADINGRRDVYEWTAGTGLELITRGTDDFDAYILDNSPSGDDVFFTTTAALVKYDTDNQPDVYDARVGGGFPGVGTRPSCDGDACQGKPQEPVVLAEPKSPLVEAVTIGKQEGAPSKLPTLTVSRKRVTSGTITLKVTPPGTGTIRVSGSGLKAKTVKVKNAKAVTVKVSLSTAAKRKVRAGHRVRVSVRVRFKPAKGKAVSKTVRLTIKRAAR